MKKELDRRKFLAVSGAGSGLLLAACANSENRGGQRQRDSARYQSFSAEDARLLTALGAAILAPQSNMPSQQEVGLLAYLDQQYASQGQSKQLAQALQGIRQEAALRWGDSAGFEDQPPDRQRELVQQLRQGKVQAKALQAPPLSQFLNGLRSHLVDGYYGHPLVWKAIGFGGRAQFSGYPDYHEWPESEEG